MRHRLGHKKLNRTSEHRKALIMNMLNSLIKYEQITTTLPKAKVLKPQADKIITLGKKQNLQNIRKLISRLQSKVTAKKVFDILSKRYNSRYNINEDKLRLNKFKASVIWITRT